MTASCHHDFEGYWQQEVDFRHKCGFPPFVHLVLLTIKCAHQERGRFSAETLARRLKEGLPAGAWLGEAAPLERMKTQYRYQLLMRGKSAFKLSRHVKATLAKLQLPLDVSVVVDVDPYQLM